tara:strand:+ start:1064 stop:2011 length:948 start_codon:yes stop_codon:yes gene_type:complete
MKNNILVITPIKHIKGLLGKLKKNSIVTLHENISKKKFLKLNDQFDAIFTNPNKTNIYLGEQNLRHLKKIKVICTASTGINHIDTDYCKKKNIKIINIAKDKKIINRISSTAELAFGLTLALIRNIVPSFIDVQKKNWDYEKFIGRQINSLKVGIIGYGRLGKLYHKYCKVFGAQTKIYDPFVKVKSKDFISLKKLLMNSDIISMHIHAAKNFKFMDKKKINLMKKNICLINTSRGEIIDEDELVKFLKKNKLAKVGTDVLFNEVKNKFSSSLYKYSKKSINQVLITPHIGGMTFEGQELAYTHAAKKLYSYLNE